jgi:protein-S-isoprenylcysteine O-methyltransferase Ste14
MTTATKPSMPIRRQLIRALIKPGNTLPAFVWLFLVFNQALNSGFPPSPSTVGLVVINTTALVLFMIRRDARRVGNPLEGLLAISGTFVESFLKDAGQLSNAQLLPTLLQAVALLGWAASLATLGRSFGIVPADRGLVQHGPYRFVRHPIYAFEALFSVGYLAAVPTTRSFVIIGVWCVLQALRVFREERILAGYDDYRRQVRWRVLPGVW